MALQYSLLVTVRSTSWRLVPRGPPGLVLPHPMTVAVSPAKVLEEVAGRQIGAMVLEKVRGELRVRIAMSLTKLIWL